MAATKMTFTLDDATVRRLEDLAKQLAKPESEVAAEAIRQYHERIDKPAGPLSKSEKQRMLEALDEIMCRPRARRISFGSASTLARDLLGLGRHGGRKHR